MRRTIQEVSSRGRGKREQIEGVGRGTKKKNDEEARLSRRACEK